MKKIAGENKEDVREVKGVLVGPWNSSLNKLRDWDPAWAEQCFDMTTNPWTNGILPLKTIELICIAVNAACTNLNQDGTRRHIRAALEAGATREEILTVLNHLTSIDHDLTVLREHTADKQQPFSAVLACADSRVPVELIFDQTIGHIFVTRVAGNIVTPEIIASLEYGVAVLGVKALLVLGHSSCGAVKAAMKTETVPGQISTLYPHLRQSVEQSGGNLDKAIEANARIQAELLRTSSTVIRDAVTANKLRVEAGVYDLASGKVMLR